MENKPKLFFLFYMSLVRSMLHTDKSQRIVLMIAILIQCSSSQTTVDQFRPSNLELVPPRIIVESSGVVNLFCINHQTGDLPFVIHLSKNISKEYLTLSRHQINETTLHLRMYFKNYLGIFHLYCYLQNQKHSGIRADIIVKKDSQAIQLIERCRVYERMFIKCIFNAPIVARAINNDFPFEFQFIETSRLPTYSSRYVFLKNESLHESLVFQWYPNDHGHFPDHVQMNMSIRMPHFSPVFYRFNLTPIFVIKPKFTLKRVSMNQIQICSNSIHSNAICQKRLGIRRKDLDLFVQSNWTPIRSSRKITIVFRLQSDTIYEVCLRCREKLDDPQGEEECQQLRTSNVQVLLPVVVSLGLIIIILIGCIYLFHRKPRSPTPQYSSESIGPPVDEDPVIEDNRIGYEYIFARTNT